TRRRQRPGVHAMAADPVRLLQAREIERYAVDVQEAVARIGSRIGRGIVLLEGGSALFQGDVPAVELQPDPAAVVVSAIAQAVGNGKFIRGAQDPRRDAAAVSGVAFEGKERRDL